MLSSHVNAQPLWQTSNHAGMALASTVVSALKSRVGHEHRFDRVTVQDAEPRKQYITSSTTYWMSSVHRRLCVICEDPH